MARIPHLLLLAAFEFPLFILLVLAMLAVGAFDFWMLRK